jgi:hypothetical protein
MLLVVVVIQYNSMLIYMETQRLRGGLHSSQMHKQQKTKQYWTKQNNERNYNYKFTLNGTGNK